MSPRQGFLGRVQTRLANSRPIKRLRRAFTDRLPFLVLESDVRDIVYANWIVPVAAVRNFIPQYVEVIEKDRMTILTVLTYSHGHFGPSLAGYFRRFFASPFQSNWRLYVRSIAGVAPKRPTVLFLANIFNSDLYALGARLFSDVMLSHRAQKFEHQRIGTDWITKISGDGSAPSMELRVTEGTDAMLPATFDAFFSDFSDALRLLCLQEAAVAPVCGEIGLAISEIELPIDIQSATPLLVDTYVAGDLLKSLGAENSPFCFRVPGVKFRAISEKLIQ